MRNQKHLKFWLKSQYPKFWSLLNRRAQHTLPPGIVEYIGEGTQSQIKSGRKHLQVIERHLSDLINFCGFKIVGDTYRRDLSGVVTEKQLAELLCEIALCASLSKLSPMLHLRPSTGKGTYCDVRFHLVGFTIYGEAKRYEDPWPHIETPNSRSDIEAPIGCSIVKAPPDQKSQETARPRYMDLQSKLYRVPQQFPEGTLNILFIFHSSRGESSRYIQQSLFGEANFFKKPSEVCLQEDGLFATEDWRIMSVCYLSRVEPDGILICPVIWKNPRALAPIPKPVRNVLDGLKPQIK